MPITYDEAYKEITARFATEFVAAFVPGILGVTTAPEIRYQDNEKPGIPSGNFVRFVMDPVIERQANLRDGENGKRYTAEGLIIIQLLMERENPQAAELTRLVGMMTRDIFRGKCFDGGIVFRNVRINRLAPDAKSARSNVIAEYEYDEIG